MVLTMEMKCFYCKKEAKVGEPYISYETNMGMINFCSEECEQQCAEDQAESDANCEGGENGREM